MLRLILLLGATSAAELECLWQRLMAIFAFHNVDMAAESAFFFRYATSDFGIWNILFAAESSQTFSCLTGSSVDSEPVPGMSDCHRPGEVTPEINLLLCVARAFRKFVVELLGHFFNSAVEH